MATYRCILEDSHLRAVAAVALRTHGFDAPRSAFEQKTRELFDTGTKLRDDVFPRRMARFMSTTDYREMERVDPCIWSGLPRTAGVGFLQVSVLHGMVPLAAGEGEEVAIAGALFNAGIALLDYIVDEQKQGDALFGLLNVDLLAGVFDTRRDFEASIVEACANISDARLRLLLAIVGAWGAIVRALYERSGNHAAWRSLARLVSRMYEAQRDVSAARAERPTLESIEAKSALPSGALLEMLHLARAGSEESMEPARRAAAALGRIVSRVDDLIDLPGDARRGDANAILTRLFEETEADGRTWVSDADVYGAIESTVMEIMELLEPASFVFAGDPEALRAPLMAVCDFARLLAAGWIGWGRDEATSRARPPSSPTTAAESAAVEFLVQQQRTGFEEAIHHLRFPRLPSSTVEYQTLPALLFQRAMILDGLLDASNAGLPVPRATIDAEVLAILRAKHRTVRGGWSYIPGAPELPPDADDLGAVVRALYRAGGAALASTCDEGIRLALDGAAASGGGFPTWILDPRGRSMGDYHIDAYLRVVDGWGVHPEVVANLIGSLMDYEPRRYADAIVKAASYLRGTQEAGGAFPSRWYAGPYYGTWRVSSVLGAMAPNGDTLARARGFLVDRQQPDGSWEGEAHDTALAVLAIVEGRMPGCGDICGRALRYLFEAQDADGSWRAGPFISFGTSDGPVTYASRTVTTLLCLKAIIAARSRRLT